MNEDYDKQQQRRTEWLASLKEGDKVAVYQSGVWSNQGWNVSTVTRITPKRMFDLDVFNGLRFDKDGKHRTPGRYSGSYEMTELTEEIKLKINTNRLRSRVVSAIDKLDFKTLPMETLVQFAKILFEKGDDNA